MHVFQMPGSFLSICTAYVQLLHYKQSNNSGSFQLITKSIVPEENYATLMAIMDSKGSLDKGLAKSPEVF